MGSVINDPWHLWVVIQLFDYHLCCFEPFAHELISLPHIDPKPPWVLWCPTWGTNANCLPLQGRPISCQYRRISLPKWGPILNLLLCARYINHMYWRFLDMNGCMWLWSSWGQCYLLEHHGKVVSRTVTEPKASDGIPWSQRRPARADAQCGVEAGAQRRGDNLSPPGTTQMSLLETTWRRLIGLQHGEVEPILCQYQPSGGTSTVDGAPSSSGVCSSPTRCKQVIYGGPGLKLDTCGEIRGMWLPTGHACSRERAAEDTRPACC